MRKHYAQRAVQILQILKEERENDSAFRERQAPHARETQKHLNHMTWCRLAKGVGSDLINKQVTDEDDPRAVIYDLKRGISSPSIINIKKRTIAQIWADFIPYTGDSRSNDLILKTTRLSSKAPLTKTKKGKSKYTGGY